MAESREHPAARDQVSLTFAAWSNGMTATQLELQLQLHGINYDRRLRLVSARLVNPDLRRGVSRV